LKHFRKAQENPRDKLYNILLIEANATFSTTFKKLIETRLPASVTIARNAEMARKLLSNSAEQFFIGITSVLNLDSSEFEKVDTLAEFNIPIIAIVNDFEDEMRDKLIKHHVIDYVIKDNALHGIYICDLIARIYKNSSAKVLVIDDSMVSRFVIVRELKLQKFEVFECNNGKDALFILEQHPDIQLVLVDNQMPNMNGYTFTEKARMLYSKDTLVIIGISSSLDPRTAVKFLKSGANDFISKPFNYEILLCRVTQSLDMLDAVSLAKNLSYTDFLSGLYNRRYFFEQGNKLLLTLTQDDPLTVMMFDIDHFKKINDTYGHDIGDLVIKNFADLLKTYFVGDIVARVGGEEFAVISTSENHITNLDAIEKFRLTVANQILMIKETMLQYTCSIGVYNLVHNDLDLMMCSADKNLYQAKQLGRNQVYIDT
jgi:diguanylate cyclase (GGDEF)-like protein